MTIISKEEVERQEAARLAYSLALESLLAKAVEDEVKTATAAKSAYPEEYIAVLEAASAAGFEFKFETTLAGFKVRKAMEEKRKAKEAK